jgi:3-O-acyltransferase
MPRPAAFPGPAKPDAAAPDLPSLTGYRFVLAFVVLICHATFASSVYRDETLRDLLSLTGPLSVGAVASFFLLSGFVLTWSAPRHDTGRRFWRRRFWKIMPNHVVAWSVAVVFILVASEPSPIMDAPTDAAPGTALANLFLVQNWVPDTDYFFGYNGPAWSISCEAFFYLLFPFLLPAVRRIAARNLWRWWSLVAAAIPLLAIAGLLASGPTLDARSSLNSTQLWFVYVFPPVRLLDFTLGILAARLVQEGRWIEVPRPVLIGLPAVAFVLIPVLPPTFVFDALCVPLFLVIPALAMKDIKLRRSALRRRGVVTLGRSSYALYIIHYPIIMIARQMAGTGREFGAGMGTLLVLGMMALSLLAAQLLYRYVEAPLMRRYARARSAPVVDPPTVEKSYI